MSAPPSPPSRQTVLDDINCALVLAQHSPLREPAIRVINRLRDDVEGLLPAARTAAERLPEGTRRRDVGLSSVAFADKLLHTGAEGPCEHRLRLWAKTAGTMLAYSSPPCRREAGR